MSGSDGSHFYPICANYHYLLVWVSGKKSYSGTATTDKFKINGAMQHCFQNSKQATSVLLSTLLIHASSSPSFYSRELETDQPPPSSRTLQFLKCTSEETRSKQTGGFQWSLEQRNTAVSLCRCFLFILSSSFLFHVHLGSFRDNIQQHCCSIS